MQKRFRVLSPLVAIVMLWSSSAWAQQRHVVDASAMREAVTQQIATDEQNRAVVLRVLQRPQVQNLAVHLGLDVQRAETAVRTMSSADLADLAAPARAADAALAGGDTIVITTTTLLLLLILIVLIVR